MAVDDEPREPRSWQEVARGRSWYSKPRYGVSWLAARIAYDLYRSPFLALAKLLAVFALPLGAITYCTEAKGRHRDRIYRTWEVVSKANGESASPARYEALQDLVDNGVALAKIDIPNAWLEGIDLRGADLRFADLSASHLAEAELSCRGLWAFRHKCVNLRWADLSGADLAWAKLEGANLSRARVIGADFTCASFRGANLLGLRGWEAATWWGANLTKVADLPDSLLASGLLDSAEVDTRPMPESVRRTCVRGRPGTARATDTLPLGP